MGITTGQQVKPYQPYVGWVQEAAQPLAVPTGKSLEVYEQMLLDPTVLGALRIKQHLVLARGWEVQGEGREADFVRDALAAMQGSVEQALLHLLSGFGYGIGICELVWGQYAEGPWAGYYYPQALKPISPVGLKFGRDEFGNLKSIKAPSSGGQMQEWPAEKFVIYRHNAGPKFPLGVSDLATIYEAWRMKTNSWIDFADALWRAKGVSTAIIESEVAPVEGVEGTDEPTREDRELIDLIAEKLHGNMVMYLPPGTEVKPFDFKLDATGYQIAQQLSAKQIMQGILGVTLLMDEGASSGSYALGQVHWDVVRGQISVIQRQLAEECMTEQLIRKMMEANFGGTMNVPVLHLRPPLEQDRTQLIQAVTQLAMAGLIDPDTVRQPVMDALGIDTDTGGQTSIIADDDDRQRVER